MSHPIILLETYVRALPYTIAIGAAIGHFEIGREKTIHNQKLKLNDNDIAHIGSRAFLGNVTVTENITLLTNIFI